MAAIINFVDVAAAPTSHNLDLDLFPVTQADDIHAKKEMIKFLLLVNKQGQPRIVQHYVPTQQEEYNAMLHDIIRKCLIRGEKQV